MTRSDITTTLANPLPRINLANGRSMPADRCKVPGRDSEIWTTERFVVDSKSVDSKSPMHSFELRTSSTLPRCSRVTSKPEVTPGQKSAWGKSPLISSHPVSAPPDQAQGLTRISSAFADDTLGIVETAAALAKSELPRVRFTLPHSTMG